MNDLYLGRRYCGDGSFHKNGQTKQMTISVIDVTLDGDLCCTRHGFGDFVFPQTEWFEFLKTAKELKGK